MNNCTDIVIVSDYHLNQISFRWFDRAPGGGGGTDKALRFYLMEASVWARRIPRYQATYERLAARRGKRIGRIAVARMMLRSIFKMLKEGVAFRPAA